MNLLEHGFHDLMMVGFGVAAYLIARLAYSNWKLEKNTERVEKLEFEKEVKDVRETVETKPLPDLIDDLDHPRKRDE